MMMDFEFLPGLLLRAPFYSFESYDPAQLPAILQDQNFRNAIWLASPVFYGLIRAKHFDFGKLNEKEKFTLGKYYNRMCYRPTPFGSFASFTDLHWEGAEPVSLSAGGDALLHLLPDRGLSTANFKVARPFTPATLLIKNPTLYRLGDYFRLLTTAHGKNGRLRFTIDQLDAVAFNTRLLGLFDQGPQPAGRLEQWIVQQAACSPPEANDYLRYLVEDQIIYTRDQGQLIAAGNMEPQRSAETWQEFRRSPLSGIGELAARAAELPSNGESAARFYAALERPRLSGGLPESDREALLQAIGLLTRLAQPSPQEALQKFISDFSARFDQQKVPLLRAVDPDAGISYGDRIGRPPGHQWLADIHFPAAAEKPAPQWDQLRRLFMKAWLSDQRPDRNSPIDLATIDLGETLPDTAEGLPPSMAVLFRKTSDHLVIESIGGCSATQLAGRFSLFSQPVHALCQQIACHEQAVNTGVVFADIEQQSDTYLDNINQRRPIYPYVIPLNVYSLMAPEQQLLPEDLTLCVRSGELLLESLRLEKRVIPRLASAYNYHHNESPLFRLLGDLQYQGLRSNPGLDLSVLFPGLGFYPRVSYGRVVLSPAQWALTPEETASLAGVLSAGGPAAVIDRPLPRWISVGQHDQQLVIDLEKDADRVLLRQWLKGRDRAVIKEYLPADRSVRAGGEALAGQFAGILKRSGKTYTAAVKDTHRPRQAARSFLPGSDWLYVKFYCTPASAGVLLEKLIRPVVEKYHARIRCWFFIRYTDPGYHLRLRIRVKGNDTGQLLVALRSQLKRVKLEELVRQMSCETYCREMERYGARYIVQTEEVFRAGSDLVLGYPDLKESDEFGLGLRTAYRMVKLCYPQAAAALAFVKDLRERYLAEFKADKRLKIDMDRKYRGLRPEITAGLAGDTQKLRGLSVRLGRLLEMIPLKEEMTRRCLLADLVHMQLNRTFRQSQRQQELLVYYCLHKYLSSALRRGDPVY